MTNERDSDNDVDQLPLYRLTQKGVTVNIPVPDFEGLVTHYPGDNRGARIVNGVVVKTGSLQPIGMSHARHAPHLTP